MRPLLEIKQKNKQKIIYLLCTQEHLSKKRLAIQLGLSPAVLTKLCSELINEKLIIETDPISSNKAGRKEIGLTINTHFGYFIGITLNHNKTIVILSDLKMNILDETCINTSHKAYSHLDNVINSLYELINRNNIDISKILGIAISIKGHTDGVYSYTGIWDTTINVKDYLSSKIDIPIVIDNGIRCSAMLEQFSNNDLSNFIFIKYMLPGIGGATVKHNRVQRGENHLITDFGHIIVDPKGPYCPICKRRGCLESTISLEKILSYAKTIFSVKESPILFEICEGDISNISIKNILKSAEKGSIPFNILLKDVANYFAIALINTIAITDFKKIIIIGDLFDSNRFRELLRSSLLEYQFTPLYENIKFTTHINELLSPIALAFNVFLFNLFSID